MIHYTCDRCKCEIDPDDQVRYVVQLEAKPVRTNSFSEFADDVDHLGELNEILETAEVDTMESEASDIHSESFDMCQSCYEAFRRNPVGRELNFAVGFSNN
ncbi:MAG: hypothetical protein AAF989_15160 [Planctomycetota bacterium]